MHLSFGKEAYMHLHVWPATFRQKGMGLTFFKRPIPLYFESFQLERLFCEPKASNLPPNKTLPKLGFELEAEIEKMPGWINYSQIINRYILTRPKLFSIDWNIFIKGRPTKPIAHKCINRN